MKLYYQILKPKIKEASFERSKQSRILTIIFGTSEILSGIVILITFGKYGTNLPLIISSINARYRHEKAREG